MVIIFYSQGGIPDLLSTAKVVLQEWNAGKIPYYALPPAEAAASSESSEAAIVSSWGAEFDMDKLLEENQSEAVAALPSVKSGAFVPMVCSHSLFNSENFPFSY